MAGDGDIAGQRECEAAAVRVPVNGGNDGLAQSMDLFEQAGHEFQGGKGAYKVTSCGAEQRPDGGALSGIRIFGAGLEVCAGAE